MNLKIYILMRNLGLSLLGLVFFITGCDSGGDSDSENAKSGIISGSVNLYDEGTTAIDNSGMTVIAFDDTRSVSGTTDVQGNFTLNDVPFGTYTLMYQKNGFGTFKRFGLSHADTGTGITQLNEIPSLGELSTTQVPNLEARVEGSDVFLSVTTNPGGNNSNSRYIRYFLHTNTNVSNENYTYFSSGIVSRINPLELTLNAQDLINAGFTSGQTVYAKVYGDSFWSNHYEDPELGRTIFPNLNGTSANFVSFVVP